MPDRLLKYKLNLLYFVVFGSLACFSPFLTPYLERRGLTYSQIGIVLAVSSLVAVIVQPLWGIFTDKYANKRFTLVLTMAASSLFVFGFIFAGSFYIILGIVTLFMVFQSPIISVNDAYCYEIIDANKGIQYGRIRLLGSIGYAIAALVLGFVIKFTDINAPFLVYFVFILIGIAALNSIHFRGNNIRSIVDFRDIYLILRNNKYIILTLSALIANIALGINASYISVLIEKTGGGVSQLGLLWFIVAMSELPVFFFGSRLLKKVGILNSYLMGILFYSIRYFLDALCPSYQAVLAVQLLQGITFPLYLMTTLQYISDIMPPQTRTTALTVFAAACGIGGFIGNMGGGFLLQSSGVFILFRVAASICIAALLIGLVLKRSDRVKP